MLDKPRCIVAVSLKFEMSRSEMRDKGSASDIFFGEKDSI